VVFCFIGVFFLSREPPLTEETIQATSIEDFDIVLLAGRSLRSRCIRLFGGRAEEWSHVGILHKENGEIFILHATPDTRDGNAILYERLGALFERKAVSGFRIVRLTGLTPVQWDTVRLRFEKERLETYPFDYSFDAQEHTRVYCSELVLMVFSGIICDLDTKQIVYPGVFGTLTNCVTVLEHLK